MARTVRTKVFKFSELSTAAKQVAISKFYDINVSHEWWDFTYEDAANVGLKITGFDLDRNKHCTGNFEYSANEVAVNILKEHGEQCNTYAMATAFMEEWQPVFNNYMDEQHPDYESSDSEAKLNDIESDFLTNILNEYADILQREYEYLTSEQVVIETIIANDYEFTEDGRQF